MLRELQPPAGGEPAARAYTLTDLGVQLSVAGRPEEALPAEREANLPSDRLRVSVGDFEQLDVATASADAVFGVGVPLDTLRRRSRTDRRACCDPGGAIAIVDLIQVDSPSDLGFFAAARPDSTNATGRVTQAPPTPPVSMSTRPFAQPWRLTGSSHE